MWEAARRELFFSCIDESSFYLATAHGFRLQHFQKGMGLVESTKVTDCRSERPCTSSSVVLG